jgi:uncharacterized protein YbcI
MNESAEATPAAYATAARGEMAATISREAVRILREYTGRGPTKARTVINTDLVAIIFKDTLTKGEAKLAEMGKGEYVLEVRRQYQRAMKDDLVSLVEITTGRKVIAFLSDNHLDPDVAVESFVLEPAENRGDGAAHTTASATSDGDVLA